MHNLARVANNVDPGFENTKNFTLLSLPLDAIDLKAGGTISRCPYNKAVFSWSGDVT